MRKSLLLIVLIFGASIAFGQPRIDNVQRIIANPFSDVLITGEGFSNTMTDLQVWFGSVKGTIVSSTTTSITVTVPASARVSFVEVIHLPSRKSARSADKFTPNFSGVQPFTNNFTSTSATSIDDIFDLCSCDFDGDGKPDIAGGKHKEGKTNIMMLRNTSTVAANNTTMSFASPQTITLSTPSYSVNCGDLNGDGKPELIATRGGNTTGSTVFVFQNTSTVGTISFAAPISLTLNASDFAKEISINDLNRDGRPEIVVTNGAQSNTIYIFENKLTSSTIVATEFTRVDRAVLGLPTTGGSLALETADMTGDGWPDILVAANSSATTVFIMTNPANGTLNFTGSSSKSGGQNIQDLAVADINHDGRLDYICADRDLLNNSVNGAVLIYLNQGGLTFSSPIILQTATAWGVDVADMNGDGFVDIVAGGRVFLDPKVHIFINSGAATPTFTSNTITTPKANWFVKAADFDGDSKPDIAATSTNNATSFSIDVWKNKNCHQALILNEDPLTICNPQTITLKAVPLQGVTYSWSHPTNGVTAGATRNITVADANNNLTVTAVGEGGTCSTNDVITVVAGGGTVPATPTITGPSGVCSGNSITVSTSNAADSWEWSGPNGFTSSLQNPPAITNATTDNAGDYLLRIKVSGCYSDYATKPITVVPADPFSISGEAAVCVGEAITLNVNSASGTSGYDFQWKKNGSNVGTNSSSYSIVSAAESDQDSYTVAVSHQAPIVCNSTTPAFALTVYSKPVAAFTRTPDQVCVGTEVSFDATTTTVDNTAPAPVFSWNFGDTNSGNGATSSHTYSAPQAGVIVALTVSYTGVAGCSDASDNAAAAANFNVNSATAPTITATPNVTEICGDGTETVILDVIGTYTSYAWTPTAPDAASLSVDGPGTFAVITTDANGCTGNVEITLTSKAGCEAGNPGIPRVFTPNGDTSNDLWIISGIPNIDACGMSIFDGRGKRVLEVKGFPASGWDGIANGKPVPDGTYFYVLGCPGSKPITGSVLVVR